MSSMMSFHGRGGGGDERDPEEMRLVKKQLAIRHFINTNDKYWIKTNAQVWAGWLRYTAKSKACKLRVLRMVQQRLATATTQTFDAWRVYYRTKCTHRYRLEKMADSSGVRKCRTALDEWLEFMRFNRRERGLVARHTWSVVLTADVTIGEAVYPAGSTFGVNASYLRIALRAWSSVARQQVKGDRETRLKFLESAVQELQELTKGLVDQLSEAREMTAAHHAEQAQIWTDHHGSNAGSRERRLEAFGQKMVFRMHTWFMKKIFFAWCDYAEESKRQKYVLEKALFRLGQNFLRATFTPWVRRFRSKQLQKNNDVMEGVNNLLRETITTMDELAGGEGGLNSMADFKKLMNGKQDNDDLEIAEMKRQLAQMDYLVETNNKEQSAQWKTLAEDATRKRELNIERFLVSKMKRSNSSLVDTSFVGWATVVSRARVVTYQARKFLNLMKMHKLCNCFNNWYDFTVDMARLQYILHRGRDRSRLSLLRKCYIAWNCSARSRGSAQRHLLKAAVTGLATNVEAMHSRLEGAADLDTVAALGEELKMQSELQESQNAKVDSVFKNMVEERITEETRARDLRIHRFTLLLSSKSGTGLKQACFDGWVWCLLHNSRKNVTQKRQRRIVQNLRSNVQAKCFRRWKAATRIAPLVVLVSSRMRQQELLINTIRSDAAVVPYDWENTSLKELVTAVKDAIYPCAKVANVSLMCSGKPGAVSLLRGRRTTCESLSAGGITADELSTFWKDLGAMVQRGGRIDLLASSTAGSPKGIKLVSQLELLTDRTVAAAVDASPLSGRIHMWQGDKLIMLSSRVNHQRMLVDATLPHTIAVPYQYGKTESTEIIKWARRAIAPAKTVKRIALMAHGKAGAVNVADGCKTTFETLKSEDAKVSEPIQRFWAEMGLLVEEGGSIDIVVSASSRDGEVGDTRDDKLSEELFQYTKRPVQICTTAAKESVEEDYDDFRKCQSALKVYFDEEELEDWTTGKA